MAKFNACGAVWNPTTRTDYTYRDGTISLSGNSGAGVYAPHVSTRFIGQNDFEQVGSGDSVQRAEDLPELYSERAKCCGCSACASVCPKGAISMEPDEEGFLYPVVDVRLCVGCGACLRACAFKRTE